MFFEDWSIDYDLWGDTGAQTFAAAEAAVSALYGGGDDDYLVGGSGTDWLYQYDQGWLGNLTGFKYVFPTSAYTSHVSL